MTQLENVYLMNVALYLPLIDIPKFIQINHKAKESIESLRINPIDTGKRKEMKRNFHIINTYFPNLQTLYLRRRSYIEICSNPDKYRHLFPKVKLFRTNRFLPNKTFQLDDPLVKRIQRGINRIELHNKTDSMRNYDHLTSVKLYPQTIISAGKELMKNRLNLDQHIIYTTDTDILLTKPIIKYLNDFSKYYQVTCVEYKRISSSFDSFKKIIRKIVDRCEEMNGKILFKLYYLNNIRVFFTLNELRRINRSEMKVYDMNQLIDKDYYPYQFSYNQITNYMEDYTCQEKIIHIKKSGTYHLPETTGTLICGKNAIVKISNWNDLNQLKKISHYDYNINTPKEFYSIEKNKQKTLFTEYLGFGYQIFLFLFLVGIIGKCIVSMYSNGIQSIDEHFKSTFSFMIIFFVISILFAITNAAGALIDTSRLFFMNDFVDEVMEQQKAVIYCVFPLVLLRYYPLKGMSIFGFHWFVVNYISYMIKAEKDCLTVKLRRFLERFNIDISSQVSVYYKKLKGYMKKYNKFNMISMSMCFVSSLFNANGLMLVICTLMSCISVFYTFSLFT